MLSRGDASGVVVVDAARGSGDGVAPKASQDFEEFGHRKPSTSSESRLAFGEPLYIRTFRGSGRPENVANPGHAVAS